jgi:hypothetical protein
LHDLLGVGIRRKALAGALTHTISSL